MLFELSVALNEISISKAKGIFNILVSRKSVHILEFPGAIWKVLYIL